MVGGSKDDGGLDVERDHVKLLDPQTRIGEQWKASEGHIQLLLIERGGDDCWIDCDTAELSVGKSFGPDPGPFRQGDPADKPNGQTRAVPTERRLVLSHLRRLYSVS